MSNDDGMPELEDLNNNKASASKSRKKSVDSDNDFKLVKSKRKHNEDKMESEEKESDMPPLDDIEEDIDEEELKKFLLESKNDTDKIEGLNRKKKLK